jgi:hypothetical protein
MSVDITHTVGWGRSESEDLQVKQQNPCEALGAPQNGRPPTYSERETCLWWLSAQYLDGHLTLEERQEYERKFGLTRSENRLANVGRQ